MADLPEICQLSSRVLLLCENLAEQRSSPEVLDRVTLVVAGGAAADVVWSSEGSPSPFHWPKPIMRQTKNEAERRSIASEAVRDYARYLRRGGSQLGPGVMPPHLAAAGAGRGCGGVAGILTCDHAVVASGMQELVAAAGARAGAGGANTTAGDPETASVVVWSFKPDLRAWQQVVTMVLLRAAQPTGVLGRLLVHASRITTDMEKATKHIERLQENIAQAKKATLNIKAQILRERKLRLERMCEALNEKKLIIADLRGGKGRCDSEVEDEETSSRGSSRDGGSDRGDDDGGSGVSPKKKRPRGRGGGGGGGGSSSRDGTAGRGGRLVNGGKGKGRTNGGTQGTGAKLSSPTADEPYLSQSGTKETTVEDLLATPLDGDGAAAGGGSFKAGLNGGRSAASATSAAVPMAVPAVTAPSLGGKRKKKWSYLDFTSSDSDDDGIR